MRNILQFSFLAIVIVIFMTSQNLFSVPTGVCELLLLCYIALSSYEKNWKITIRKTKMTQYVWNFWILPMVVIMILSVIRQLFLGLSSDYLQRTILLSLRIILYTLFAAAPVKVNREKTVKLLLWGCIFAYLPAFFRFFMQYGLLGGMRLLLSSDVFYGGVSLEVHTLTYIFGFCAVYYTSEWLISKKNVKKETLLAWIFTFMGVKRIVIFALLGTAVLVILFSRIKLKNRMRIISIGSVAMVFFGILYLYLIRYGILKEIFTVLGISDSFRFNFWDLVERKYEVSPWFVGYGLSYSQRIVMHEWRLVKDLNSAQHIHNDILGFYLGLGFWGFLLYWWIFFYKRSKVLNRIASSDAAGFCFAISVFYFLVMMTSNEGLREHPQCIFFLLIYAKACADMKEQPGYGSNREMITGQNYSE